MYTIIKSQDGTYQAWCRIQDGTETATFSSAPEAIKELIQMAKVLNHDTITVKDITFLQEVVIVRESLERVPWNYQPRHVQ